MKHKAAEASITLSANRNQLKSLLGIETQMIVVPEVLCLDRNQLKSLLGIETKIRGDRTHHPQIAIN